MATTDETEASDQLSCTSMELLNQLMNVPTMAMNCCPTIMACPAGYPTTCYAACAAGFMPVYNACAELLSSPAAAAIPQMVREVLDTTADRCNEDPYSLAVDSKPSRGGGRGGGNGGGH
jgi:hypothetical protein